MARASGFFTSLLSSLEKEPTGRNFALLLVACLNHDQVFSKAFRRCVGAGTRERVTWAVEKPLIYGRRPDITAVNDDGTIVVLLEIKWDDHRSKRNRDQFVDYAEYQKVHQSECVVAVVSKHWIPDQLCAPGLDVHWMSDICRELEMLGGDSWGGKFVLEFLRDCGVVMEVVQPTIVNKLLHRLLGEHNGAGRVRARDQLNYDVPAALSSLLTNMNILSEQIGDWAAVAKNRPVADFTVRPRVKILKSEIERAGKNAIFKHSEEEFEKVGGSLFVYADASKPSVALDGRWVYLQWGYHLEWEVDRKVSEPVDARLFGIVSTGTGAGTGPDFESEAVLRRARLFGKKPMSREQQVAKLKELLVESAKEVASSKELRHVAAKRELLRITSLPVD